MPAWKTQVGDDLLVKIIPGDEQDRVTKEKWNRCEQVNIKLLDGTGSKTCTVQPKRNPREDF